MPEEDNPLAPMLESLTKLEMRVEALETENNNLKKSLESTQQLNRALLTQKGNPSATPSVEDEEKKKRMENVHNHLKEIL